MGQVLGFSGVVVGSAVIAAVDANGVATLIAQIVITVLAFFLGGKGKKD